MKYTFSCFMRYNKWHIHDKKIEFSFYYNNFKRDRCFALYDVKTETTGAGVGKVKISANPDNFITKIFLVI